MIQYSGKEDYMLVQSSGRHQKWFASDLYVILTVFILVAPGCTTNRKGRQAKTQPADSTSAVPVSGDSTAGIQNPNSLQSAEGENLVTERKDVEQRMSRFLDLLETRESAVLEREHDVLIKERHVRRVWTVSIILFILGLVMLIAGAGLTLYNRKFFRFPKQNDEPVRKRAAPSKTAKE